jgi:hypothetical protein
MSRQFASGSETSGDCAEWSLGTFSIAKNAIADVHFAVAAIIVQCNNKLAF